MKTIEINEDDIQGTFITPPGGHGQIVTVSYACTEKYVLARVYDASDRSESILAYEWPKGSFDPQNRTPKLGKAIGSVVLVQP